jgi:hypothetical protein
MQYVLMCMIIYSTALRITWSSRYQAIVILLKNAMNTSFIPAKRNQTLQSLL